MIRYLQYRFLRSTRRLINEQLNPDSRPGNNYLNGGIVNLSVGNTEIAEGTARKHPRYRKGKEY